MINKYWMLLITVLMIKNDIGVDGYCNKSLETLQNVTACPSTKLDWDSAAQRKNCEFYAKNQTCSDRMKFKYHCVSNVFRNETMEVCAPERKIIGYCSEFNIQGATIQANYEYELRCKNASKSCTIIYNSTDSYLYPECYPTKTSSESTTRQYFNLTNTGDTPQRESDNSNLGLVLGLIFGILIIIVLTAIGSFFFIRKRCQTNTRVPKNTDEMDTNLKLLQQTSQTEEEENLPFGYMKEENTPTKDISSSTATDRHTFIAKRTPKDLSEENIADTERYMKTYETFNKYFVETRMYEEAKDCLAKNSVVILTGPPGCGKTNAAIHLMFQPVYEGWTLRKIRSFTEFAYLEFDKKSLVFIDNIFYDNMYSFDLENWWNEFDKIFDNSIRGRKDSLSRIGPDLHLIITARENIIEKACLYMKRVTPVFNEKCIINESKFELSEKEKDDILSKQEDFAVKERHMRRIEFKGGSEEKMSIKKSPKGPIGFPLCAHLFACNDEYRKIGTRFFSRPTEFLKIEIEEEIENDKSNKTKTLFFVLFLYQWHLDYVHANVKLNLRSEAQCKKFLNSISTNFLQHFGPFDFGDLPNVAKKLSGAFFIKEVEGVFKFLHDSVFEAVGVYFCERYFTETAQFFPLEVLQMQPYVSLEEGRRRSLSLRLIYEIFNRKLSQIFTFTIFKRMEFVNCFCDELKSRDDTFIKQFFAAVDDNSSIKLPATFWASRNRLSHLSSLMFELIRGKGIDEDFHFYVSLYGICCSINENLLTRTNGLLRNNFDEIKKRVFEFEDEDYHSILHIVILSDFSDTDAAYIVQKLARDGIDVNHRNKCSLTPLMVAVQQTFPRSKVIKELLALGDVKVKSKDVNNCNVIHHCLMSRNNDTTCVNNLELLLQSKKDDILKIINNDNNEGRTALNVAAKQNRFSRVLSILLLLKCEGIKTDTLDCEGCSPIHNTLKSLTDGCSSLALLERCVRVIIFIEYGVSPDIKNDEKNQAVDLTKNVNLTNILKCSKDAAVKESNLDDVLRDIERKHGKRETWGVEIPNLPNEVPDRLKSRIQQAVQYLANECFKTAT